ncbi:hypothetical protein GCM10018793_56440 [Streptomyces sulfonofaciens]|uniref:HTH marR-type domain-containing protein n=1 Tax=Streptomyces sulfonofaciens TaxID=68272 RepID=A0A919GK81_9ACTN|nr:MarR family transcriptional regulator [Streptomyces sulfonofaciens]GHH86042.1 hypothetical protein GCM10018793_56440 [Streptomyces sulfonofaciens]
MTAPDLDPTRTAVALSTALARLRSRLRQEGGTFETGMTITQLSALQRLIDHGPMSGAALAASEHLRPQSMWEVVAALGKEGLVSRGPDPTDGRKLLVAATDRGRAVVERVLTSREAWLTRAVEAVTDEREHRVLLEAAVLMKRLAEYAPEPDRG